MVVLAFCGTRHAAFPLVMVPVALPINGWREGQHVVGHGADVATHRGDEPPRGLILVVAGNAIECSCAVILRNKAGLPKQVYRICREIALVIALPFTKISVDCSAIRLRIATAKLLVHGLRHQTKGSTATKCAKRTTIGRQPNAALGLGFGHDVDGTAKSRCAKDTCRCAFEHLDAVDVRKRNGKIGGIVPCLGVANVHAIQQNGNLVERSAVDRDVRLNSKASALTDIHARD